MGQAACPAIDGKPLLILAPFAQCHESPSKFSRKRQHSRQDSREGEVISLRPERLELFAPHEYFRFKDCYELIRKIGEGASADVWEAARLPIRPHESSVPSHSDQRRTAVKIFDSKCRRQNETYKTQMQFFTTEWQTMAQLEHPHILRMYECFVDPDSSFLYLVMEFCSGGELIEYVKGETRRRGQGGLDESDARKLFRQMLYACNYMSHRNIVHRDIKLENFLLLRRGDSLLKLCDFGTAVLLTENAPRAPGRIGTLSYTSPEVCSDRGAGLLADAWSLGVVLYVLLVGSKPFRSKVDEPREETLTRIAVGDFNQTRSSWRSASTDSKDLVRALITVEESCRCTTSEALAHPWCLMDVPSVENLNSEAVDAWKTLSNPINFLDPLQRFVLYLVSQLVSEADLLLTNVWHPWYYLFFLLDSDKDGCLDVRELAAGLHGNAFVKHQVIDVLRALDLNGSDTIEWSEWAALALLSAGGIALSDELLYNAVRLLCNSSSLDDRKSSGVFSKEHASEEVVEVLPSELDIQSGNLFLSPRSRSPPSASRVSELHERFAKWLHIHVAPPTGDAKRNDSSKDITLDDLREILESTSWLHQDGDSWPQPWDMPVLPLGASTTESTMEFLRDDYYHLEATPFASPRDVESSATLFRTLSSPRELEKEMEGIPCGPPAVSTMLVKLANNHSSSAPNSPRSSNGSARSWC